MPINCPLQFNGSCNNTCPNFSWDKCTWYFPAKPLREILTVDERLDIIYAQIESFEFVIPSRVLRQQRKELNEVKSKLSHIENKINEHIDKAKERVKKTRKKTGAVQV